MVQELCFVLSLTNSAAFGKTYRGALPSRAVHNLASLAYLCVRGVQCHRRRGSSPPLPVGGCQVASRIHDEGTMELLELSQKDCVCTRDRRDQTEIGRRNTGNRGCIECWRDVDVGE